MIRLPKLFKRNSQSDDLEIGSAGARRTTKKTSPRAFQRAFESQEESLTEDPEQQRARHRLIGAAALVLIAVIGLPRILDSKPKASNNDIAVNIVASFPSPMPTTSPAPVTASAPEVKSVERVETQATVVPASKDKEPASTKTVVAPAATSTQSATKTPALGLAAGEEVVASSAAKQPKADALVKPNASGSGKFVIQIGAFASEERAKGWIVKLKDQKIPNYVLNKNSADGTKLFVLRAGPYSDKDAAESAEKKIKALGLTPRLVEVGSP